ncbi:MAG: alkaline phosphatase PhoX [Ilumatobacteraceae bacterium]
MELSRRELLVFLGVVGAASAVDLGLPDIVLADDDSGGLLGRRGLTPVRLPHDLPAYARPSYLPGVGVGNYSASLPTYTVIDDLVVGPELERYVIVGFGDRVFPSADDYFGFNCDYTSFRARRSRNEGWLYVNHEYVSYPMSLGAPGTPAAIASAVPKPLTSFGPSVGFEIDGGNQLLRWGEFMYVSGGSVVYLRRNRRTKQYAPVSGHGDNRRYHLLSGMAINAERGDVRTDGTPYNTLTSWGPASHQQGDDNYLIGTGPAADEVFNLSSDGLGNRIVGYGYNCSGGFTPWGTILTCEENFQAGGPFFQGCQENVKADGTQTGYVVATPSIITDVPSGATFLNQSTGAFFGQVGEKYGWVVELDPSDPTWRARKHTALGRFRHENVALRADGGSPLVGYMGDDRRGGHTWKYVSNGVVGANEDHDRGHGHGHGDDDDHDDHDEIGRDEGSALFADGVLHVARFNADGTGQWIPMTLDTLVDPIAPSALAAAEAAGRGVAVGTIVAAKVRLPRRVGIAGQTVEGGPFDATVANEATVLPAYRTLEGTVAQATLGNYYSSQGAIVTDAFLAAGLAGGTNTARPEDLEINPRRHNEVFIAYTDAAPGGDGYPDSNVFHVGKYAANVDATQQSGGLYKIIEDTHDGTGLTFRWERFKQGGEAGTVEGDGFANVDNLAFDEKGNLWGVTDMSTEMHNGLSVTYTPAPALQPGLQPIDHTTTTTPGAAALTGVFGNNWLFVVPMRGPDAGSIIPVAHGPVRCEMTGPTFVGDTLILSVQHPGEDSPVNGDPAAGGDAASLITRAIEVLALDGTTFTQQRTIPRGSNWPSAQSAVPPRPSVVGVRRRKRADS